MMSISSDRQIDRTLSALGAVEPSLGFENRVLRGLEERAREPGQGRTAGGYSGVFRIATALGAALLLAILAFIAYAPRRMHDGSLAGLPSRPALSPRISAASAENSVAPRAGDPDPAVSNTAAIRNGLRPPVPLRVVLAPGRPSAAEIPVRLEIEAYSAAIASARELDAQALEDFRAPSSPAPPLPLTAQERLVRLMLRRGEKHDLAQLDAAEQAAFASQEQSAFHEFFDPPADPRILHQAEAEQEPQSTSTTNPKSEGKPQ